MDSASLQRLFCRQGIVCTGPGNYRGEYTHPGDTSLAQRFDPDHSPCVDYGRTLACTPRLCVEPSSIEELSWVLGELSSRGEMVITRGAGHSAGGQCLRDGAVILDLRRLNRVSFSEDMFCVEGGARWRDVIEAGVPHSRRPPVLIGSQRTSVGGTLSVGGFGDRTHCAGLQIDNVKTLDVVAADGRIYTHQQAGDALFDFVLGGRGQLGIIARATIPSVALQSEVWVRPLKFSTVGDYLRAAEVVQNDHRVAAFPAWLSPRGEAVDALLGVGADRKLEFEELRPLTADHIGPFESVDVVDVLRQDNRVGQRFSSPCLEVVCPLDQIHHLLPLLLARLRRLGIGRFLRDGIPLLMVQANPSLPLHPVPVTCDRSLVVALRPVMDTARAVVVWEGLQALADELVNAGARIYLMGAEGTASDFLKKQFGASVARSFAQLKERSDPHCRFNPWLSMEYAVREERGVSPSVR